MSPIRTRHISFLLLGLFCLYPIFRFDWSSKILIGLTLVILIDGVTHRKFEFTKRTVIKFLNHSLFYVLLVISILYSLNTKDAIDFVIQMSPLFLAVFFYSFYNFKISEARKNDLLSVFIGANFILSILIIVIFLNNNQENSSELFSFFFDYDKFQFIVTDKPNTFHVFIHKSYYSMGFVLSALVCFWRALKKKKSDKNRWINLVSFVYFAIWVLYAFSYPNVLILVLFTLFGILENPKRRKINVIVFLILVMPIFFIKIQDNDVKRGFNFFKTTLGNAEYELSDLRIQVYQSAYRIIKESSAIDKFFGVGIGDVQDELNKDYTSLFKQNQNKNLLYHTENFDNPFWYKNNIEVLPNLRGELDYKGADLLVSKIFTDSSLSRNISVKVPVETKDTLTFSGYIKPYSTPYFLMRVGSIEQRAVFDLNSEKVAENREIISSSIQKVNDDWFRCSVTTLPKKDGLVLIGFSNSDLAYSFKSTKEMKLGFWGAQLEYGSQTAYQKSNNDNYKELLKQRLNTHNNYLFFFLATGILGLLSFLWFLLLLFKSAIRPFDFEKLVFVSIIICNGLTENIFERQWGLMFLVLGFFLFCIPEKNTVDRGEKVI